MKNEYINIKEFVDEAIVRFDEPMAKHTTMKVGGVADVMVNPQSIEDVVNTLKYVKANNIPMTIIGNGSKLLVLDGGIRGLVLKIGSKFAEYVVEGEYITVQAGMTMPRLATVAKNNSLKGLEFASGIPGCVGGGVFMNAGAYGGDMAAVITEVTFLDDNLEVKTLTKNELQFGYRTSYFKNNVGKNYVILSAKFKLEKGNKDEIEKKMLENNESRKTKQPLEYPSAGSTFKRPEGYFVGKLVEDLGLKGYKIGGAQISEKHSGFIVNVDKAKAADVLELINFTKKKVLEANNVKLEEEIIIIGEGEL